MKAVKIPTETDIGLVANPEVEDANKVVDLVKRQQIATDAQLKRSVNWIAEIKTQHDAVDEKRKSFVDPLRTVIEDINGFFKPALDTLKKAEKVMKDKVAGYTTDQLRKRDQVLADVASTDDPEERGDILAKADEYDVPKVPGMSVRETWGGTITDMDKIIDWAVGAHRYELLIANEKALKALTKGMGRDPGIPGWKAEVKRTVAVTVSKVDPA